MKSLNKLLGAVAGIGLSLLPIQKIYSQESGLYGKWGINFKASPSASVQNIPDSLDALKLDSDLTESAMTDTNFEAQFGFRYAPAEWFNIRTGARVNVSLNSPTEDYFGLSCSSPQGSVSAGISSRASLIELFFAEYSVDFPKHYSFIAADDPNKLADFIDHNLRAGISLKIGTSPYDDRTMQAINSFPYHNPLPETHYKHVIDLSVGLDIPQIINKTSLGDEMGISAKPKFVFSATFGGEWE
ncbi:hypothetical protein M0R72_04300 [Candidatus Pacearchaeota archaeon]|jgi:hypothetical protein|nr:hypothetical protein [Candidatus Pacearchaeota archaeon]